MAKTMKAQMSQQSAKKPFSRQVKQARARISTTKIGTFSFFRVFRHPSTGQFKKSKFKHGIHTTSTTCMHRHLDTTKDVQYDTNSTIASVSAAVFQVIRFPYFPRLLQERTSVDKWHLGFSTGRMSFPLPNQQCHSINGNSGN